MDAEIFGIDRPAIEGVILTLHCDLTAASMDRRAALRLFVPNRRKYRKFDRISHR